MIYVLYGEDEFSKREFLETLRQQVGPAELLESNTTVLNGVGLRVRHLEEVCCAVPFLAEHRLVVVQGLLGQFDDVRIEGRDGRPSAAKEALEEWQDSPAALAHIAPSTFLVFSDDSLRRDNPLLGVLAPVAQVRQFAPLRGEALEKWIRGRAAGVGTTVAPQAMRRLVELVGGNLWALSGEIEKLALYTGSQAPIGEEAVELLVAHAREESVFRAVDAVLAGQSAKAMQLIGWLRDSGEGVSYLLVMLARQLRLILLAQEFIEQGVSGLDLGSRLGLTYEFAVRQTTEQARRHSRERVEGMYRQLLETDVAIKRGELDEDLALEVLVAELCYDSKGRKGISTRAVSR